MHEPGYRCSTALAIVRHPKTNDATHPQTERVREGPASHLANDANDADDDDDNMTMLCMAFVRCG